MRIHSHLVTSAVWEMGRLKNDLIRLKPETHTSSPLPLPIICLFLKAKNLKCTSKTSSDACKSQSLWFSDWISIEESWSFKLCFLCLPEHTGKGVNSRLRTAIGGFLSYFQCLPQVPESRHFGRGQRALVLFN